MSGFGSSPAGSSPAGIGSLISTEGPSGIVFREENTTRTLNCRKINPVTGDYVYNASGRAEGDTTASQLVQLALTTNFGSSSLPNFGEDRTSLERITDDYPKKVYNVVQAALKTYIDAGQIELLDVITDKISNRRVQRRVRWRDLTTGQIGETAVAVTSGGGVE